MWCKLTQFYTSVKVSNSLESKSHINLTFTGFISKTGFQLLPLSTVLTMTICNPQRWGNSLEMFKQKSRIHTSDSYVGQGLGWRISKIPFNFIVLWFYNNWKYLKCFDCKSTLAKQDISCRMVNSSPMTIFDFISRDVLWRKLK